MPKLRAEPLTAAAFAPFGEVIEKRPDAGHTINAGMAERFHDLAEVDAAEAAGHPLVNIFRGKPWALPLTVRMLERHPLSSQAFVPLGRQPFLVVVAPPGDRPQPGGVRAFLAQNGQGVNYRRGVWHHPLIALDEVTDFLVIDRGGAGANCDEVSFPEGADALVVTLPR